MQKNNINEYNNIKDCYGKKFDKLEKCEHCQERPWCKEAIDPKLVNNSTYLNIEQQEDDSGDDSPFDRLLDVYQEHKDIPNYDISEEDDKITEFIRSLLNYCDKRPDRIALIIMRIAGMTYEDIGYAFDKMYGSKTKQAVLKDIKRISDNNEYVGEVIKKKYKSHRIINAPIRKIVDEYLKIKRDNNNNRLDYECFKYLSEKYNIPYKLIRNRIHNYIYRNRNLKNAKKHDI